ncbi:hypothetical protein K504DRAFT_499628 [Pleomassaria siparia CBS 279.74]|uniref:Uncharacterized protein n=1 Tax=Pleomassaria siparia CBS 279.74 TaxID=1314801 RepID=A0A6G1KIU2_9PLEO|nr:hypothetical protein K504DRAFT_499628 [Pleomassaria siparia CBS 279.74]
MATPHLTTSSDRPSTVQDRGYLFLPVLAVILGPLPSGLSSRPIAHSPVFLRGSFLIKVLLQLETDKCHVKGRILSLYSLGWASTTSDVVCSQLHRDAWFAYGHLIVLYSPEETMLQVLIQRAPGQIGSRCTLPGLFLLRTSWVTLTHGPSCELLTPACFATATPHTLTTHFRKYIVQTVEC